MDVANAIIEAALVGREGVVGVPGITKRNGMALWAQAHISGEALLVGALELASALWRKIQRFIDNSPGLRKAPVEGK